jgi:hypothetical protein
LSKGGFAKNSRKKAVWKQTLTANVEDIAGSLESLVWREAHREYRLPLIPLRITLYFISAKRNTPWAPHPIQFASTMT